MKSKNKEIPGENFPHGRLKLSSLISFGIVVYGGGNQTLEIAMEITRRTMCIVILSIVV